MIRRELILEKKRRNQLPVVGIKMLCWGYMLCLSVWRLEYYSGGVYGEVWLMVMRRWGAAFLLGVFSIKEDDAQKVKVAP